MGQKPSKIAQELGADLVTRYDFEPALWGVSVIRLASDSELSAVEWKLFFGLAACLAMCHLFHSKTRLLSSCSKVSIRWQPYNYLVYISMENGVI